MRQDNLTIKSQEAIQAALDNAHGHGHQAVEPGHLLKGLFNTAGNIVGYLLQKTALNRETIERTLDAILENYPKVSGGEVYLSQDANRVLQKAMQISQQEGDQFVAVEHILFGILETPGEISEMLKDQGLKKQELKKAIAELKKGSNVDRDFEASTSVFEPALRGEYYILKNKVESSYRFSKGEEFFGSLIGMLDLYVYAGVSPVFYKVNPNDNLLPFVDKDGGVTVAIPVGVGLNFILSPNILLGADIGHRFTFTDYLDGYTSQYSKYNDRYYFMNFVFTYKLKTSVKGLPSFRK